MKTALKIQRDGMKLLRIFNRLQTINIDLE